MTIRREPGIVVMHLRMPESDYEALKQAGAKVLRSANREALWRIRQSQRQKPTPRRTKQPAGAKAVSR
jgi:hypothetical protein